MADNEEKLNIGADINDAVPTDGGADTAAAADAAEAETAAESGAPETETETAPDMDSTADVETARRRRRFALRGRSKSRDGKKSKKAKLIAAVLLVVAVLLGAVGISAIIDSNRLEKTFYQVKSNKVTDNIRIVCLSDMHLKEFGKDNENLIHEVDKLSPDLITLVGDMNMENKPDKYDAVINLCVKLNEIAPVYYSLGNHEIDAMLFKGSNIYKDVKKAGIKIMNNETETVTIGGTDIDIIGLTQNPTEFEEYGKEFFDKAMSATDNFKLVLNHYPEQFFGTLDDYNIDLALAGHAHGGQVRLPWIGGLYAADQGFFPKLCDGYHEIGNSRLLITRGLGKSGLCPRIFNKPEIMVVDIGWY